MINQYINKILLLDHKDAGPIVDESINESRYLIEAIKYILSHSSMKQNWNICAVLSHDIRDKGLKPYLLNAIINDESEGNRGTLVWACQAFDCSDDIVLFSRIMVSDSYESYLSSFNILSNSFERSNSVSLHISKNILSSINENHDTDRISMINELIRIIDNLV